MFEKLKKVKKVEKPVIDWDCAIRRRFDPDCFSIYSLRDLNCSYIGVMSHETEYKFVVQVGGFIELCNKYGEVKGSSHKQIENFSRAWYVDSFGDVCYTDDAEKQKKLKEIFRTKASAELAAKNR